MWCESRKHTLRHPYRGYWRVLRVDRPRAGPDLLSLLGKVAPLFFGPMLTQLHGHKISYPPDRVNPRQFRRHHFSKGHALQQQ